jgi:UDP-N-acetylglucosamine 2-epimerase
MKVVTIAGTRPEFIQTSRVSHAIRQRHVEVFVNTGQHYDDLMSRIFFRELDIPKPDVDLNVGSEGATHAVQTAHILMKLEPVLQRERPDWVIVYGDTNSTIAGALAAAKLNLPIAHIEAGLRSFDRKMPEEINRILTDHVSDLLLAPTAAAVANLAHEGITRGVSNVGDVRVDVLAAFVPKAREHQSELLIRCCLTRDQPFALATIHRASNTDDPVRLAAIVAAFEQLEVPVVIPVHPRLEKMLRSAGITLGRSVRTVEPLGFLDMLALLDACEIVVTDSGGLQKEAYMLHRPCITVRDTTEWTETVESGWNRLTAATGLSAAVALARKSRPEHHPDLYGLPGVSERLVDALER